MPGHVLGLPPRVSNGHEETSPACWRCSGAVWLGLVNGQWTSCCWYLAVGDETEEWLVILKLWTWVLVL